MNRTQLTWANGLTLIRLLIIMPLALAIIDLAFAGAAVMFTLAVVTDVYDGKIARKLNQTSAFGGLFDHGTDALFVTVATAACAWAGLINPFLSGFIMLAFVQYMLDSNALSGVSLRTSSLGKANGVAYYVLVGTVIGTELLDLAWLRPIVPIFAWLLVCTTLASMLDRLNSILRRRGSTDSN